MNYLLDTNTCSVYLNGRSENVLAHWRIKKPNQIILCAPVKAELYYGALKGNAPQKHLARLEKFFKPYASLPFDDRCARICGALRAELARVGTPIGPNDLLIAAIALVHGLIVATHNVREFARVKGLIIDDWQASAT